jgi:hypothetical protein
LAAGFAGALTGALAAAFFTGAGLALEAGLAGAGFFFTAGAGFLTAFLEVGLLAMAVLLGRFNAG